MDKCFYRRGKVSLSGTILAVGIFLLTAVRGIGQTSNNSIYRLTIAEAIEFSKSQNKWVQTANMEVNAVNEDRKDVIRAKLPTVNVNGSYQRFSGLTLFTDGLSHATTGERKPTSNSAALGIDALFNIYGGGRQHASEQEQHLRVNLARLNAQDQSGNIALQTATQYLNLVKLNDLEKFLADQLNRAQVRLNNINALYRNQKVTRSDVLRAEVSLSNVELSLEQNENDIAIANQHLDVLLNVPDSVVIIPADSAGMTKPEVSSLLQLAQSAEVSSYTVQKAATGVEIQATKLRSIRSSNLPNVSFYAAYGLNYPNYLFFPPVNQAYSVGFVGLKAQYSISSLYHNKSKMAAARIRVKEAEIQREAYADNVRLDVRSHYVKYAEALRRIEVNEHSVEQAEVNYRIVNNKYLNQLALLTDLLDADNLYQESRFNLIKAQTDALNIYYHIRYASGNL
ncbi:TolC family protein [Chitinophaga filiformis]|uniref:Outer membrane protein TolC n=1 Tax=Chitinophaga filiformis TaxID=104663 RepID=A0A1G7SBD2_CHIFI|nr:TolC family protein [Chitinophaga filiformis]SDG20212.1 Outer membrane protein TolC [Chitinophaga filiformis]